MKEVVTYGLLGHPLEHSFSKVFFAELLKDTGMKYDNFDLPELTIIALYDLLLKYSNLEGFNVTAPYKEQIMSMLDTIDPIAHTVGAVNTVVVERYESGALRALHGFNSDVVGFRDSISKLLENQKPEAGALILGTGGASKAAAYVFGQQNRLYLKVSRTQQIPGEIIRYDDITAELLEQYPIVVNCTPAGTYPNVDTCPPFPYELIKPGMVFFDMVYNPDPSLFLRKAAASGATIKSGAEMLVLQALESWRLWNTVPRIYNFRRK